MPSCFSRVQLFATLWTVAPQAPLSMGFSRKGYWHGLPCPSHGDLPNPGMALESLMSPALAGRFFASRATWEACWRSLGKLSGLPWREGCSRRKQSALHCATGIRAAISWGLSLGESSSHSQGIMTRISVGYSVFGFCGACFHRGKGLLCKDRPEEGAKGLETRREPRAGSREQDADPQRAGEAASCPRRLLLACCALSGALRASLPISHAGPGTPGPHRLPTCSVHQDNINYEYLL